MKNYDGKKVTYKAYPAMFRVNPLKWLLYFLLSFVLVGLVLFGMWWFRSYSKRLILTDVDAIYIQGVFNTKMTEIRLADIRLVEVDQSIWGKLVGVGSIKIASAGSDGWEIEIDNLPKINQLKRRLTSKHQ